MIDDLHILCPRYDSGPSENERKLTASLCSQLDSLHRAPPPAHVVVIATTNQIDGVEPSLRRPGRFDKEVEIPVPTASDRREVVFISGHSFVPGPFPCLQYLHTEKLGMGPGDEAKVANHYYFIIL